MLSLAFRSVELLIYHVLIVVVDRVSRLRVAATRRRSCASTRRT